MAYSAATRGTFKLQAQVLTWFFSISSLIITSKGSEIQCDSMYMNLVTDMPLKFLLCFRSAVAREYLNPENDGISNFMICFTFDLFSILLSVIL